jgi:hypothetical protein
MQIRRSVTVAIFSVSAASCDKAVVSEKSVPVVPKSGNAGVRQPVTDPTVRTEIPNPAVKDGSPVNNVPLQQQKASVRISPPVCSGERITSLVIKSSDINAGQETVVSCGDQEKLFTIATEQSKCISLNLTAQVVFKKENKTYYRSSKIDFDKNFFQFEDVKAADGTSAGLKIKFEDMSTEYWNEAWDFCKKNPAGVVALVPSTLKEQQKCSEIINGYDETDQMSPDFGKFIPPAIDWKDFTVSITGSDVAFTVEGFPQVGCRK